jgi:chromosome segregation ATPase
MNTLEVQGLLSSEHSTQKHLGSSPSDTTEHAVDKPGAMSALSTLHQRRLSVVESFDGFIESLFETIKERQNQITDLEAELYRARHDLSQTNSQIAMIKALEGEYEKQLSEAKRKIVDVTRVLRDLATQNKEFEERALKAETQASVEKRNSDAAIRRLVRAERELRLLKTALTEAGQRNETVSREPSTSSVTTPVHVEQELVI